MGLRRPLACSCEGWPAGRPGYGPSQVLGGSEDCGRHWGREVLGTTSPVRHAPSLRSVHHRWAVACRFVESGPYSGPAVSASVGELLSGLTEV